MTRTPLGRVSGIVRRVTPSLWSGGSDDGHVMSGQCDDISPRDWPPAIGSRFTIEWYYEDNDSGSRARCCVVTFEQAPADQESEESRDDRLLPQIPNTCLPSVALPLDAEAEAIVDSLCNRRQGHKPKETP